MAARELDPRNLTARRWFMNQCGIGLGSIALTQMLGQGSAHGTAATSDPMAVRPPHYSPKVKNVIFLFMAGAPSQYETFDYKPKLAEFNGTLPPPDLLKGYRAAFIDPNSKLLGPKFKFAKHGQAGAEISELLPHTARIAACACCSGFEVLSGARKSIAWAAAIASMAIALRVFSIIFFSLMAAVIPIET